MKETAEQIINAESPGLLKAARELIDAVEIVDSGERVEVLGSGEVIGEPTLAVYAALSRVGSVGGWCLSCVYAALLAHRRDTAYCCGASLGRMVIDGLRLTAGMTRREVDAALARLMNDREDKDQPERATPQPSDWAERTITQVAADRKLARETVAAMTIRELSEDADKEARRLVMLAKDALVRAVKGEG